MANENERRIDTAVATLAWGDAATWKARLREESRRAFEEQPLAERLRKALSMIARRNGDAGAR